MAHPMRAAKPVELPGSMDWGLEFSHRAPRAALDYWRALRGDRAMPLRSELSPSAMRDFLLHVALVDAHVSPGGDRRYFVRLAGMRVEQVFGSVGGKYFGDFLPPELHARWLIAYDAVRDHRKPLRIRATVNFEKKSWLACEALVAPLGDDTKPVAGFFVVFAAWADLTSPSGADVSYL